MDGTVEAMSTDGTILLGYAAQNEGELKVVGDAFSEERIGVGYPKDHPEMCQWITETLKKCRGRRRLGQGVRERPSASRRAGARRNRRR